jgi:hypothetical protein
MWVHRIAGGRFFVSRMRGQQTVAHLMQEHSPQPLCAARSTKYHPLCSCPGMLLPFGWERDRTSKDVASPGTCLT